MKKYHCALFVFATMLLLACGSNSRQSEIEARKAALKNKQDSTLLATQQELATTDSLLEIVKSQYAVMEASVNKKREALTATEKDLSEMNMLRMKRDSLQVQWETLGAKIRYIRKRQAEADSIL
jgi:hypothetical protein